MDNVQIAILTKVNELAARFGIQATVLRYEVPVSGEPAKVARFEKMLDLVGLGEATHDLKGTDAQIIDALDNAIRLTPKQRTRL